MDLGKFEDDRVVSEWILVKEEHTERVDLPTEIGDWNKGNEIRAEIYMPGGVDGQITSSLTSGETSGRIGRNFGSPQSATIQLEFLPRGGETPLAPISGFPLVVKSETFD